MKKDTREVLDTVRGKIPPNAKLLVCWMVPGENVLHAAQSNLTHGDVQEIAQSLTEGPKTRNGLLVR